MDAFRKFNKLFLPFALLAFVMLSPAFAQSNKTVNISADACAMTAATTAFTAGPAWIRAAAGNPVWQATTNSTSGTITVTCDLTEVATRIGSAARIRSVSVFYGLQTTALASIGAATVNSVLMATPGAAAAGTVTTTAGGSLTVTPASLQLTTTTAGQCFNERIVLGTPFAPQDSTRFTLEQVFTTNGAGSTVTVFQICSVQVNYVDVV